MYREYRVWNLTTRLFHWINALSIIVLTTLGLIMLWRTELGFTGLSAKIAFKELHIIVGYLFTINLFLRIILGFFASKHNNLQCLFKINLIEIKDYITSLRSRQHLRYIGHNPLGRIAILTMYLLFIIISITGLVRAGTDVYYPPFGSLVTEYIAKPGINPSQLQPYNEAQVNAVNYKKLADFQASLRPYSPLFFLHIGVIDSGPYLSSYLYGT